MRSLNLDCSVIPRGSLEHRFKSSIHKLCPASSTVSTQLITSTCTPGPTHHLGYQMLPELCVCEIQVVEFQDVMASSSILRRIITAMHGIPLQPKTLREGTASHCTCLDSDGNLGVLKCAAPPLLWSTLPCTPFVLPDLRRKTLEKRYRGHAPHMQST